MSGAAKKGLPVIGIIFLALALFKFLQGEEWIIWAILGALFGGLSIFRSGKIEGSEP